MPEEEKGTKKNMFGVEDDAKDVFQQADQAPESTEEKTEEATTEETKEEESIEKTEEKKEDTTEETTEKEEETEETKEEEKTEKEITDEEAAERKASAVDELIGVINDATEYTDVMADKFNTIEKSKETIEKLVKDKEEYLERNQEVFNVLKNDPYLMDIMRDQIENKVSFLEAFAKNVDGSLLHTEAGDPDNEAIEKLYADRKTKEKDLTTFRDTLAVNSEESDRITKAFMEERKFTEEKEKEFKEKLKKHMTDLYSGKVTKEFLGLTADGFTKPEDDKKTKKAIEDAEIKGRNENIKKNIKPKPKKSDELPDLKGTNKAEEREKTARKQAEENIFEAVDSSSNRNNLFN